MTCLTYPQLRRMWLDAEWASNMYRELGVYTEAIRYLKISIRLYNAMMNCENVNSPRLK